VSGSPPFHLRPDYADRELDALDAALRLPPFDPWHLSVIVGSAVLALGAALLAEALGAARPRDGTLVVMMMALIWAGIGFSWLGRLATRRRERLAARIWLRDELAGLRICVGSRGVVARRSSVLVALRWAAVAHVEHRGGLMLLHGGAGTVIALPERLLTPAQRAFVLSRAEPLHDDE
jgi:hypothetical protein